MEKHIKEIAEEAAKLLKEFPELKYYEALEMAKKMYERKGEKDEGRGSN